MFIHSLKIPCFFDKFSFLLAIEITHSHKAATNKAKQKMKFYDNNNLSEVNCISALRSSGEKYKNIYQKHRERKKFVGFPSKSKNNNNKNNNNDDNNKNNITIRRKLII